MRADLLIINKIDLAPYVGADLERMRRDAAGARGERPFFFTDLRAGVGLADVVRFVERAALLDAV
jgi:urease accessory protein